MGFWKRIDDELQYLGMSRKDLAFYSDIPLATIHKAIERDSEIYISVAIRIAEALGVSLEYLLDLPSGVVTKVHPKNKKSTEQIREMQETKTAVRLYRKYVKYIENMEKLPAKKLEAIGKVIELMVE